MKIRDFSLERYFAEHEFSVPHHLSSSDCESLSVGDVLELAGQDPEILLQLGLGYTESRGDPALRQEIARFYPECELDDILVTNAPEEAIFLAMHAILESGDRVVVQTPCYQSLLEVAASIGCDVARWPLVVGDDAWQLDFEKLASLLPGARLLVLNAPHNPTGHQPSQAERDRVIAMAREHNVRIFSDEMYRGLAPDDGAELVPAASAYDRALSLWGMSKTFSLPGLRIGWLACRDSQLLDRIARLKDYTTICSNAVGELLTRLALQSAETIKARNRAIIAKSCQHVEALIAEHRDELSWIPPQAGSVALARVHNEPASAFCDRAREHANVLLAPSSLFDMGDRHVRFGLGRAGFTDALARLGSWLGR